MPPRNDRGLSFSLYCMWSVVRGYAWPVVVWICKYRRHEAMERRLIWRPGHLGSLPGLGRESRGKCLDPSGSRCED